LLTDQYIQEIEDKLNERPRKRYRFESPRQRMKKLLFNQEVAFVT